MSTGFHGKPLITPALFSRPPPDRPGEEGDLPRGVVVGAALRGRPGPAGNENRAPTQGRPYRALSLPSGGGRLGEGGLGEGGLTPAANSARRRSRRRRGRRRRPARWGGRSGRGGG